MGLLGGLAKAGIAKKAFNEARKPRNQARIKDMIGRVTGSKGNRTAQTRRRRQP